MRTLQPVPPFCPQERDASMPIPVFIACCFRRTAHDDTLETAAPNPLVGRPATPVDGNSREGAETRRQDNRPVLPAGNAQRQAILAALKSITTEHRRT